MCEVSDVQVCCLYVCVFDQVCVVLWFYGYYEVLVDGDLQLVGKDWCVILYVKLGELVKIIEVYVSFGDIVVVIGLICCVQWVIEWFKGQIFNYGVYDVVCDVLSGQFIVYGFFGVKLVIYWVEVICVSYSVVVCLVWEIGLCYCFGQVQFEGLQFCKGFLDCYVLFKLGDYFLQDQLFDLQQVFNGVDYFLVVNVLLDVDDVRDGMVIVKVELVLVKCIVYIGGLFIGIDIGFGLCGGVI